MSRWVDEEGSLGYSISNRVILDGVAAMGDGAAATLKRELAGLPHVRRAALSSDAPPLGGTNNTVVSLVATAGEDTLVEALRVDHDFFAVYGVSPLAGRLFSADFPTDAYRPGLGDSQPPTQGIVVNETFLAKVGVSNPEAAIGADVWDRFGQGDQRMLTRSTIVGVVRDMHLRTPSNTAFIWWRRREWNLPE